VPWLFCAVAVLCYAMAVLWLFSSTCPV